MLLLQEFCCKSQAHDKSDLKKQSANQQDTEECRFPKKTFLQNTYTLFYKKKNLSPVTGS
jgi:hypothetical protein